MKTFIFALLLILIILFCGITKYINELLFAMLIVAILMAIKYYVFDIPLNDKKQYELDKIEDERRMSESGD